MASEIASETAPKTVPATGPQHPADESNTCSHDHGARSPWLIRSIRWYQRLVEGRPSPCRFFPSCSSYAIEALEVHGTRRGAWLAVRRLARCRPLGPSGFDPVPPRRTTEGTASVDARASSAPVVPTRSIAPRAVEVN